VQAVPFLFVALDAADVTQHHQLPQAVQLDRVEFLRDDGRDPRRVAQVQEEGLEVSVVLLKDALLVGVVPLGAGIRRGEEGLDVQAEAVPGVDVVLEMSGSEKGLEQGLSLLRKGGRLSAFGLFPQPVSIDITNRIIFKGITLYGINGRILFDTWYRMHNLLKSGRLDISHVITHKLPFDEFEKGFALLMERPKKAIKVVLML